MAKWIDVYHDSIDGEIVAADSDGKIYELVAGEDIQLWDGATFIGRIHLKK